jgi:hypothetical protein
VALCTSLAEFHCREYTAYLIGRPATPEPYLSKPVSLELSVNTLVAPHDVPRIAVRGGVLKLSALMSLFFDFAVSLVIAIKQDWKIR